VYPLNNICVIDNDDNKPNKKVYDLDLQQKIHNLCDNDKSNCISTTPSGGTHTIFQHQENIIYDTCFNGCVDRLAYNFDTSKNPCCIFVGWRDDGQYIPNFKKPKELNNEMLKIFKTNPESVKNFYKHNTYVEKNIINTNCKYDPNLIIDFNVDLVLEILNKFNDIDLKHFIDSKEWFKLTSICKKYEDSLPNVKEIWHKISKKGDKYNKEKNESIWDDIDDCKLDINYIIYLHNKLFENKHNSKKYFKRTMQYKPFTEENHLIKYVDLKYCSSKKDDVIHYNLLESDDEIKNIVLKSGMNTGKSTASFKHILDNKQNTISINSNKALNREHKNTLIETYGIDNVFCLNSDKDNNDDYKKLKQRIKENNQNVHLVICINSVWKLNSIWNDILWNETTLFLDEFRDTLQYLYTSSTLSRNRLKVIMTFKKLIYDVNTFFCCDGNITDLEINFLHCLNVKFNIIVNTYKSFDCPMYVLQHEEMFQKMDKNIQEGKKIMICSDTKSQVQAIESYVSEKYIKSGYWKQEEILLLYCGSEDSYESSDALKKLKMFGFSPTIKCGIDYRESACVFGFLKNKDTLTPELFSQQIARCRKPEELNIYIANIPDKPLLTSDVQYYLTNIIQSETDNYENILFDELCDKKITNGSVQKENNIESDFLVEILFQNEIQKSNYDENLLNILQKTGYKLMNASKTVISKCSKKKQTIENIEIEQYTNNTIKKSIEQTKELIKTFDDEKYRIIDPETEKETILNHYTSNERHTIQTIRDLFHIDPLYISDIEKIEQNDHISELICDNKLLARHLYIRKLSMPMKTLINIMNEKKSSDFKYNNLKNDPYNIIYILKKYMIEHLPECFDDKKSFHTFEFDAKDKQNYETIHTNIEMFKFLKNFIPKSKVELPKNKYDVMMFSVKILKMLCPSLLIEEWKNITIKSQKLKVKSVYIDIDIWNKEISIWNIKDHLTNFRIIQKQQD